MSMVGPPSGACAQAITSTRKGNKKLAIYDLKITMRWEAQDEDDGEQVRPGACSVAANRRCRWYMLCAYQTGSQ